MCKFCFTKFTLMYKEHIFVEHKETLQATAK